MITTISRAAGLAALLAAASAGAQTMGTTGATQPSNPPAPQQGVGSSGPNATTVTNGSPEATKPVGTSPSATAEAPPTKLNATDRRFVQKATVGGLAEIKEGQLAADRAQSPAVKQFGQHMVSDHTAAGDKLKSIADAEHITAPSGLDAAGKKQVGALGKAKGAAFDRQYVTGQIAAHKETVALFQQESKSGSDPQLKQFADDTLPTLRQHLADAQGLTKQ